MEKIFKLKERGTTVSKEVIGGYNNFSGDGLYFGC